LAFVLLALGDVEGARDRLEAVVVTDPLDNDARVVLDRLAGEV
jgi:hypothetical protein